MEQRPNSDGSGAYECHLPDAVERKQRFLPSPADGREGEEKHFPEKK